MRLDHKFWKFAEKQPDFISHFHTWMDYWEGCVLCACDHGCNQFLLANAAKAAALLRARGNAESLDELNQLAMKDEGEFSTELWKRSFDRASKD